MATPIAGAIVLFGFNDPIKSVITIVTVSITSILLSLVIGKMINKFNMTSLNFNLPRMKKQTN